MIIPTPLPPHNPRGGFLRTLSGSSSSAPSVQWSLPLVQERSRLSQAPPPHPSSNARPYTPIKSEKLPLEINTSIEHIPDQSSASSLSLSTMDSEEAVSSGTDDGSGGRESMDIEFKAESVPPTPMEDIKSISESSESPVGRMSRALAPARRGRGRPRKNPATPTSPKIKENKGRSSRSKTGCLTCRKRKKKCDERKPECRNCEKNNVTCEGYPAKTEWQSGKLARQRNEMSRRLSLPPLPNEVSSNVIPGLDTELDRVFFAHFNNKLSLVLTVRDDDDNNPFQQLIIPMACNNKGLMHSLLALSGSHLVRSNPNEEYTERKQWHYSQAITDLAHEVALARTRNREVEDPIVASMILQCLIPISEGTTNGEYRVHLDAARRYVKPRQDSKFGAFAWEFYKYHDMSSTVTSLYRAKTYFDDLEDDRSLPSFAVPHTIHPGDGIMIGVLDGLFKFISRITYLRDHVRARKAAGIEPCCDYPVFDQAAEIDSYLLKWETGQEKDTARDIAAELYREAILVYLRRSIRASRPEPEIAERVDRGIIYLQTLPPNNSTQSILLLPLFILGCAAFEQQQRDNIEVAFDNLEGYSKLGNIVPAREVVHKVWEMMDAGDERSWDWETIMQDMKYDLLVT